MTASSDRLQRITVLTPVAEIISRLDASVLPVALRDIAPDIAAGATLATDVVAQVDMPPQASALQDGWAVVAEQITDASSYSPVTPANAPLWVNSGRPMPEGTDTVLSVDAVTLINGTAEINTSAARAEGVLPARADITKGTVLLRVGERIRPIDAAILHNLAIAKISVRVPRVKIVALSVLDASADLVARVIADAVRADGGVPEIIYTSSPEAAFTGSDIDAVITIGGTGSGDNDQAVKSLARFGKVAFHGFGISPGQTAAFGEAGGRAVLMLPGRLDAALAVHLVVGRHLMSRLAGANEGETVLPLPLVKKVASNIGLAEVIFVRRVTGGIEPLGAGVLPLQALMQADGWILVAAESEGAPSGSIVDMRNLP